jgi:hypothetical protein
MELSSIFYTIPKGFTGGLKATLPDSYLELRSEDDYKNCNITILNCDSFGKTADGFIKQGNHLKYSNGTQTGVNFDFENGGYIIIE